MGVKSPKSEIRGPKEIRPAATARQRGERPKSGIKEARLAARNVLSAEFDRASLLWDKQIMKAVKTVAEKKTAGTLAVQRHRPLMNKLSDEERRRLRRRAAELLYGRETASTGR